MKKALSSVDKNGRREFLEFLLIIAETKETVKKRRAEVASLFATTENDMGLDDKIATVSALYDAARALYADCDFNLFNETCRRLTKNKPHVLMEYYMRAYETEQKAKTAFENLFCIVKKDRAKKLTALSTAFRVSKRIWTISRAGADTRASWKGADKKASISCWNRCLTAKSPPKTC